ncbi:transposase [Kitasatospora sp. NPDC001159]
MQVAPNRPRGTCAPTSAPSCASSTASAAGSLKGVSAPRLRQEYDDHIRKYLWGDHFRSPACFAASCGAAPLSITKEYIEDRKRPD